MNESIKLAVLVSGAGSTLQNLIDRIARRDLNASIGVVIGSKDGILALKRAADAKLMNFVVSRKAFGSVKEFSDKIFSLCDDAGVDLVCLAGWLSLLEIPERYENRIMNIHPALLPSPFAGKGMYGKRVHQAVLDYGCKVSGCTVHFVDRDYDNGPMIIQKCCPVREDDTPETLAARVGELEKEAYPDAIRLYADKKLKVQGRRVEIG